MKVNDAVFQNICDSFLYSAEENYPHLFRVGSQMGKQKTTNGTPDTLIDLENGQYIFVEYTTKDKKKKTDFVKKITSDIDSCLDETKTGIRKSNIDKIIFCVNSKLSTKDISTIKDYGKSKGIRLVLHDVTFIAIGIHSKCPYIAKEFLGIQIDSGQILTPDAFIDRYQHSGLATPLSNTFYPQEEEMKKITESLVKNSVTILTGQPGIGKSKLALEILKQFKVDNSKAKYTIYCISNREVCIYDDLKSYIKHNKNYLIFIDDANRQLDHLIKLMDLLKEKRRGIIKLVVTVRDYAYNQVLNHCIGVTHDTINIQNQGDDLIKKIMDDPEFKIDSYEAREIILDLANGNPRLAIMAARYAKKTNKVSSLYNVSDIYDEYFQNAISDPEVFTNTNLLKTLGLLSFFLSIDRTREIFDELLTKFSLSKNEFNECVDRLERLELVDVSPDFTIVSITEQTSATYFFFVAFFRKKVLDFSIILDSYFLVAQRRIQETIIPANNTFGYDNFSTLLNPYLTTYWSKIKKDQELAIQFLDLFWVYRSNDLFALVNDKLSKQPELKGTKYEFNEEEARRPFLMEKDKVLSLLFNFYHQWGEHFDTAVELSFEYVKKNPSTYTQVVKKLYESTVFSHSDYSQGFIRQLSLMNLVTKNAAKKKLIYREAFYDMVSHYMLTTYRIARRGRKENTIVSSEFKLPVVESLQNFRKLVWNYLISHLQSDRQKAIKFLYKYTEGNYKAEKSVYQFDFSFVCKFIETYLSPTSFEDCHIVQGLMLWFKKMGCDASIIKDLRTRYTMPLYERFLVLNYYRHGLRDEVDYPSYEAFEKAKHKAIEKTFTFKNLQEFKSFYQEYLSLCGLDQIRQVNIQTSFDVILWKNYIANNALGIQIIKDIIKQGNKSNVIPVGLFHEVMQRRNVEEINDLYDYIIKHDFSRRANWLHNFYSRIHDQFITKEHAKDIVKMYKEIPLDEFPFISLEYLKKYLSVDKKIFERVLQTIVACNATKPRIEILWDPVMENIEYFNNNYKLLGSAYIQQDLRKDHFDTQCKGLFQIIQMNNRFLIDYLKHCQKHYYSISTREYHHLKIVWELANAKALVKEAMMFLSKKHIPASERHFANVFFGNIDPSTRKQAIDLLKEFLKEKCKDISSVNMAFDIVRHSLSDQLDFFVKFFLTKCTDNYEIFSKIEWTDNAYVLSGDTIWGDIRAEEYGKILDAVNKIKEKAYKYAHHKSYLQDKITYAKREADEERRRRYLRRRW